MRLLKIPFLILLYCLCATSVKAQDPHDVTATVKAAYANFDSNNIPSMLALMDSQVSWIEADNYPYIDGSPYKGPEAIRKGIFDRLANDWEYFKLVDKTFYEVDSNMVLVTGYLDAKNNETGKIVHSQFAHLWEVKNGKITKFQHFADTKQVTDATRN